MVFVPSVKLRELAQQGKAGAIQGQLWNLWNLWNQIGGKKWCSIDSIDYRSIYGMIN
jgi:hypothetical protein